MAYKEEVFAELKKHRVCRLYHRRVPTRPGYIGAVEESHPGAGYGESQNSGRIQDQAIPVPASEYAEIERMTITLENLSVEGASRARLY